MAKSENISMNKFAIIEKIIKSIDFKTKEEVVNLAERMKNIAAKNKDYSADVKKAFEEAYEELTAPDLTFENLVEIKTMIAED